MTLLEESRMGTAATIRVAAASFDQVEELWVEELPLTGLTAEPAPAGSASTLVVRGCPSRADRIADPTGSGTIEPTAA